MLNVQIKKHNLRVLIGLFYPSMGGPQLNSRQLYGRLVEHGWNIHVNTHKRALEEAADLPANENIEQMQIHRYGHINYGYIPFSLGLGYFKPGIIAIHDLQPAPNVFIFFFIGILKIFKLKRFGLVFTLHGFYNERRLHPNNMKDRIENFLDLYIGFPLLNYIADAVRVLSQNEVKLIRSHGLIKPPVHVIGNGLEPASQIENIDDKVSEVFKDKIRQQGIYFVQIGRIDRIKNIEASVRALQFIHTDVRLLIVGPLEAADKKYLTSLQALTKELALEPRVVFFGSVLGYEKYYLLRHAMTIVQPSHSESFGTAVLEGMSQGLSPVVSRGTGLSELVCHDVDGFHIDQNNIQELAKKVNYFYNPSNKTSIEEMSAQSKIAASKYAWDKIADEVSNMYLDAMDSVTI